MELTVNTSKRYTIRIERGALDQLGAYCASLFAPGKKAVVITDTHVAPLYLERVSTSLRNAGFDVTSCAFPAGEPSKRLSTIEGIYGHMAQAHITRSDFAVALGGGVTGDMAGFAAASYLRGIPFVQVPTTLLSQVDSSVGGKTGVDIPQGKNLVGAFRQPARVLADLSVLDSLPPSFLTDGMAEIIKAGCILNKELFAALEAGDALSPARREATVVRAIAIKQGVVERDETETGERKLLNFGHTLGHALETYYHYTGLTHGRAVALGMAAITAASERTGLTAPGTLDRLLPVLEAYGLPVSDPAAPADYLPAVAMDKKRTGAAIDLVLLRSIGDAFIHRLPLSELPAFVGG